MGVRNRVERGSELSGRLCEEAEQREAAKTNLAFILSGAGAGTDFILAFGADLRDRLTGSWGRERVVRRKLKQGRHEPNQRFCV